MPLHSDSRTAVRGPRRLSGICGGPGAGAVTSRSTWIVRRGGRATFAQRERTIPARIGDSPRRADWQIELCCSGRGAVTRVVMGW